jgi:hypothetical protein
MTPPPLPIPLPQSNEIYMTAISVVVAIVFQDQIKNFVLDKNKGRFWRFYSLMIAIGFVYFASLIIFTVLNFMALLTPLLSSVIRLGNNYGSIFYVIGTLFLIMKPILIERPPERIKDLWTSKELAVGIILFIFGWVLNTFLVTKH